MKNKRLQQLTTQFEVLKKEDNETIFDFHSKLLILSNECFALGECILKQI